MIAESRSTKLLGGIGALVLALMLPANPASAQDTCLDSTMLLFSSGPRTSPFEPGEPSDTRFIVDDAPGLDTYCTFRSGGPLVFDIIVTRYVGPVGSDGHLLDHHALSSKGIVSANATLRMPAYDVDYGANVSPPWEPERDRLFINGIELGYLNGLNNTWILNTFTVPIEHLKFPDKGDPDGVRNTIRIDIDVANIDIGEELWCTSIDWAELSFQAVRPVLMVHGCCLGKPDDWNQIWETKFNDIQIPYENIPVGKWSSMRHNASLIASEVASMRSDYGVDRINIVSHSKGGLDSREYIRRHDDIERLVMISTPNAGSPWADLGQGLIAAVPGMSAELIEMFAAPGIFDMTTFHMKPYNLIVGQNANTQYATLAGDYDPLGWCAGSCFLIGKDDWIVQVASVQALSYAQNLAPFTTHFPDLEAHHFYILESDRVFHRLIGNFDQMSSSFTPSEPTSRPLFLMSDPSLNQQQRTASIAGEILPGEVQTHTIGVDAADQVFFNCLWTGGDLDLVLIDPDGIRIDPAAAAADEYLDHNMADIFGGIHLESYGVLQTPDPGDWMLEVTAVDVPTEGLLYFVGAFIEGSGIFFEVLPDKDYYRNSEPVALTAVLEDNSVPILGASVSARVVLPDESFESFELYDDGTHGDPMADDGMYVNSFVNTAQSGLYRMLISAEQSGAAPFTREQSLLVSVASSHSEFDGAFGDAGVDTDGDGLFNTLNIEVGLSIDLAGEYEVSGVLVDSDGRRLGDASVGSTLGIGSHTVQLSFDGFTIYANGVDGPYSLEQVTLAEVDADVAAIVDHLNSAHSTQAYSFGAFQKPSIYFTGNSTDYGTDLNSNGQFDILTVEMEVDLLRSGYYQWSANLVDEHRTVIDYAAAGASLSVGINTIQLTFDGTKIGENGVDGPYVVTSLLMFAGGTNIVTTDVASTNDYSFYEFEGAAEPLGSVEGTVMATCASDTTALLGIPVDVYNVGSGDLVGTSTTDIDGYFEIPDVPAGDNIATMVTPVGYHTTSEEILVPVTGGAASQVDFYLTCTPMVGDPRSIGFWKHQVGVATGGKGHAHIEASALCDLLDDIEVHFNYNAVNQVVVYQSPFPAAPCDAKLTTAKELLNLAGSSSMYARAQQQLTAVLLNVVAGYMHQTKVVSADGANASQAITFCDNLLDDPLGDHEKAKTIADLINNSIEVPAGLIPLSTVDITYKQTGLPVSYSLGQNYPNPFNLSTEISFRLPVASHVKLEIFNIMGQKVTILADDYRIAGHHSVTWNAETDDGRSLPSGVYFYKIEVEHFVDTKKMLLLK